MDETSELRPYIWQGVEFTAVVGPILLKLLLREQLIETLKTRILLMSRLFDGGDQIRIPMEEI